METSILDRLNKLNEEMGKLTEGIGKLEEVYSGNINIELPEWPENTRSEL